MSKKKVFIVHGHDREAKAETETLILRLGMDPIVLHRQVDKGRTLIEKVEEEGLVADFAVVLLTPDDLGKSAKETALMPRARQNVIFEFGFFIGRLGRNKVICLLKGDIEEPSDLKGIVYKRFTSSVDELENDLRQEFGDAMKIKKQIGSSPFPPLIRSAIKLGLAKPPSATELGLEAPPIVKQGFERRSQPSPPAAKQGFERKKGPWADVLAEEAEVRQRIAKKLREPD